MYKKVRLNPPPEPPREQAFDFGPAFEFGNGELFQTGDEKPSGKAGAATKYKSIFTYGNDQKNWSMQQLHPPMPYSQTERFANFCLTGIFSLLVLFLFPVLGWFSVKKLESHERLILMRLGRMREPVSGPGFTCVLPIIDSWQRIDLRPKVVKFEEHEFFTSDRGIVCFAGEAIYRVREPELAVTRATDPLAALTHLTMITVQRYVSRCETEDLDKMANKLQIDIAATLNSEAANWGMEVTGIALGPIRIASQPPPKPLLPEGIDFGTLTRHMFSQLAGGGAMGGIRVPTAGAAKSAAKNNEGAAADSAEAGPSGSSQSTDSSELPEAAALPELDEYLAKARRALHVEEIRSQLDAVYQFRLLSESGQPLADCYVDAKAAVAGRGCHPQPEVTITLSCSDLADLRSGQLPMWQALASGRIAVEGDLQVAKRLKVLND